MADILPSFETLTKLSGWATRQAAIFPRIWANPTSFFDEVSTLEGDPLPASISFFAFVIVVCFVINLPIDVAMWKVNPFSAPFVISDTVLTVLAVVLFCLGIYVGGRVLGGKANLRETMAAMLFASAFMPLVELTKYLSRLDAGYRTALMNVRFDDPSVFFSPMILLASVVQTVLLVYIVVKLVPLVKRIQSFGSIRAVTTICVAGFIHQAYTFLVDIPIGREMLASANNG
jgi:hypothetical protein